MKFVIKLFLTAISVLIASYVCGSHVEVSGFWEAVVVAAVLVLLNVTLRPLLIVLTIPVTVLTLGLFLLVINALIIMLADYLVPGLQVDNFWWALLFSIVLSLLSSFFNSMIGDDKQKQ